MEKCPISKETKLRVGFIGAGGNTRHRHLPGFQALPGIELAAVANRSLDSAQAVAREWNIPAAYAHYSEMLRNEKLDAVCIGTWPDTHLPLVEACLKAGCHVLCEARAARDLREARLLADSARRHEPLVTAIVPSPFSLGWDAIITDALASGKIGQVLHAELVQTLPPPGDSLSWRDDVGISGNNTLTLGIWYEALLRWLPPAMSVMAHATFLNRWRKDAQRGSLPVAMPDHWHLTSDHGSDLTTHMVFSRALPGLHNRLAIHGTAGSLVLEGESLHHVTSESTTSIPLPSEDFWKVEEEFVASIREGQPVLRTHPQEALRYMAFTDAVWESARSGQPATVPMG